MRNVSDKIVETIKKHAFYVLVTSFQIIAVYGLMWKKPSQARQATDYNTTRCMRIACWILKATNTHSQYVILIAFPQLQ